MTDIRTTAHLPKLVALVAIVLGSLVAHRALAQNPIVIRGRVTGPDSTPARGATIVGVSLPDSVTVRAHTDSLGSYALRFDRTSATRFVVSIAALGYAPQRRMIQRPTAGDSTVTLDLHLVSAAARLGPVVTRGERRKPASTDNTIADGAGPGTTTDFVSLTNGLTGDVTGDLTAALSMIPGVTVIPDPNGGLPTISAFGLSGQNTALLNGMSFGGGSVPRDGLRLSAVTNTYDPSVGGFAGVLTSLRFPGGNNFPSRSIHYSEDDPGLQWTPQTSNQLGARYTQRVLSGTASGPIALDRVFYDVSYQAQERLNPIVSLPTVSASAIEALGLSPDSAARLLAAVGPMGIPYRTPAIPNDSRALSGSMFSRFDFVPHPPADNGNPFPLAPPGFLFFGGNAPVDKYSLMINGGWRGQDGGGLSPTALPATGLSNRHWDARVQGNAAKYFGFVLDEATFAVSANRDHTDPYLVLPNAQILVNSTLSDGTGFVALQAGGSASGGSDSHAASMEARNEVSWYTWDQQHHFKLAADALFDDYSIAQAPSNGVFTFSSLGDFVSGKPASFSRTLTNLATRANGLSGSLSFGDQWTSVAPGSTAPGAGIPRPWQFAYGVRLEANRLGTRPPFNSAVDSAFGLRTDHVPNSFAVLPMAGFSKSFGTLEFAPGARATRATLSGGVREYRSSFATRGLDPYLRQTGLPSGVQQLFCVGSAAPAPDWSTFLATDSLPDDCANGSVGTPLALTGPSVAVLAPDFEPSTSWREAMSLNLALTRSFRLTMNATHARNTHQRSSYDVNFAPAVRFSLDDEAGRPVYVSPTSIDAQTGAVSYAESRVVSGYSHVSEARSDMESEARQLSTTLSYQPIIFGAVNRPFWFVSGTYVLNENRDRARGFDATTAGDPQLATWAWSATPRHVVQMNFTYGIPHWITTSLIGRLQSGVPYTPRVNADITGTGYANAQAYVFDPTSTADTVLASGMRALLAGAPSAARDCLLSQMGTIAARNSCTPGWWSSLNITMSPDPYRLHLGNRGRVTIILTNALAAADRLLHGASHLQGWGQPAVADPTLLTVRGFDGSSNRFLYNVNPFFGSSAMYRNAFGAPFRLTLDASFQIGPDQETVSIGSYLRPRSFENTAALNQSQIRTRLLGNSAGGMLDVILRQRDSLKLTPQQVDSMTKLNSAYQTLRDTIYTELSKYLAARNGDYAGEEVRARWHDALAKVFYAQNEMLQSMYAVLTPEQRSKIPIGFAARLRMSREDLAIQMRTPMMSPP